jgi:Flp pilus assembly protein TadG
MARAAQEGTVCRRRPTRRGSAILEFSLMLPILLMLTMLCIDFGRFAHYYIAVTNAARAGAAYASVNLYATGKKPAWDALVRQAVVDELTSNSNSWFDPSKLIVPSPVVTQEGNSQWELWRVQVDVTYPFQTLIPWPFLPAVGGRGYNDPLPLHRCVVMRGVPTYL